MNNEHFNSEQETSQDAQLRQLLTSHLPVASPSSTLQERVALLATQTSSHKPPKRPTPTRSYSWRLAIGMATIAVLIVGGSVLWPRVLTKPAMARVDLARVEAAMARVNSAHFERYRVEGEKSIKESDLWFEDGKWRIDAKERGYIGLYVKGTSWSFDAKSNTVTVDKNSQGLFQHNMTGFSFSNLVHDFGNPGSKTTVTPQGLTTVNGRTMKQAIIENTDNYENTTISLVVDAETDLPQSADMHVRTRYGKEGHWKLVFSYNDTLAPQLFKPEFGPSARFTDAPHKPGPVIARKSDKSALARQQLAQTDAKILSLEVNSHGSVFLAYRFNESAFITRGCLVGLSDSLGTKYRLGGQLTKMYPDTEDQSPRGQWWIPVKPPAPGQEWRPRTFMVDFKLPPENLRSGQSFSEDSLEGIQFSLPTTNTTGVVVPPLVRKLSSDVSEEQIIEKEQENLKSQ